MIGGRDLRAGGSWLAVTRGGRFATVTRMVIVPLSSLETATLVMSGAAFDPEPESPAGSVKEIEFAAPATPTRTSAAKVANTATRRNRPCSTRATVPAWSRRCRRAAKNANMSAFEKNMPGASSPPLIAD